MNPLGPIFVYTTLKSFYI